MCLTSPIVCCRAWVLCLAVLLGSVGTAALAVEAPEGLLLTRAELRSDGQDWAPAALPMQWRAGQAGRVELRLSLTLQA